MRCSKLESMQGLNQWSLDLKVKKVSHQSYRYASWNQTQLFTPWIQCPRNGFEHGGESKKPVTFETFVLHTSNFQFFEISRDIPNYGWYPTSANSCFDVAFFAIVFCFLGSCLKPWSGLNIFLLLGNRSTVLQFKVPLPATQDLNPEHKSKNMGKE